MIKYFKGKILAVLLVILVISICGCNNSKLKQEASNDESDITLTAWAWGPNINIPALKIAEEEYKKEHPNVKLEIVQIAQADVIQKLNAALASGSTKGLPNIVLIEDYRAPTFINAYQNAFVPLQDSIDFNNFAKYKQFYKGPNGEIYGLPFDIGLGVMYYRKDILEKAGYTEDDMQDLTWKNFQDMGHKVKDKTGINMQALQAENTGILRLLLQAQGAWYTDDKEHKPILNSPEMKKALTTYVELLKDNSNLIVSEWSQVIGAANGGTTATVIQGCWFTGNIIKEETQSGLWRVAPVPHYEGQKGYGNTGGGAWYVLQGIKNEDIAVDFLAKTLGSDEKVYEKYMNATNTVTSYLPVQKSEIFNENNKYFGEQQIYKLFGEGANNIPAIDYGDSTYQIEDIIIVAIQDILNGMSVDDALQKAQQLAESKIK